MELAKTPSFRLDGKRALVTGGGRGIGLAAASALTATGAATEPYDILVNIAGTNRPAPRRGLDAD
jgi:hypothetical protein